MANIKKLLDYMKYMRVILLWIALSTVLGFILNYNFEINDNGVFAVILGIFLCEHRNHGSQRNLVITVFGD